MKLTLLATLLLAIAAPASAQGPILFDHMDVVAPDFDAAKAWWGRHFGGKPDSRPDHVWFGKTWFAVLLKSTTAKPSAGSAIDHFAFAVPDVNAKLKELAADGAKVVAPLKTTDGIKSAFVDDPHGVRIELVEDPRASGFHHIHLKLADPEAGRRWFLRMFGGEAVKVGKVDALRYGDVNLLVSKGETPGPSEGAALDHIAFRMQRPRYDPLVAELKSDKAVFRVEPFSYGNNLINGISGKVIGPGGILIEILSRMPEYPPPQ